VKDTPSRTSWEEEESSSVSGSRANTWDLPTPYNKRDGVLSKLYFDCDKILSFSKI